MKNTIHRFMGLLAGLMLVFGSVFTAQAATSNVYVSATGSGTACTQTSPCSISTGAKNLGAGKTLVIKSGTYNTALQITKSGTAAQPIKVTGPAVIQSVVITGSYVEVSGLEVTGATQHGVTISGKHVKFSDFSVHDNVNENKSGSSCSGSGSWGSGLKVAYGGEDIQLTNGQVFHNCGEGLAVTRGINVTITNVTSYDNFSANFYLDNSKQVTLQRSFAYCTSNTNYYRSGQPATGILIGEEYYSGWGGQLGSLTIINNISYGCKGLNFYGVSSNISNGGLVGALIAHNTIWNVYGGKAISISHQPANQSITIGNNIAAGTISPDNATLKNNQSSAVFASTPGYTMTSFKLAQNSPGVNAGASLGVLTDAANNTRDSRPDVGAWEFGTSGTQATVTVAPPTATPVKSTATTAATATATIPVRPSGTVLPPKGQRSVDVRITSSGDDAEENASGGVNLTHATLELVNDSGLQTVGLRFTGINIPQGAKIVNAYIQFKSAAVSSNAVTLYVRGQAVGNAPSFSAASMNLSSRPLTMENIVWKPSAWTSAGMADVTQATPNLASLVQEIVNRTDWSAGNAMVFLISGLNDKRVAAAFDGDAAGAPLLHIEYDTTSAGQTILVPPTFTPTAVSSSTSVPVTATVTEAPTSTPAPTETPIPSETPVPTDAPTDIVPPTEEPPTPTPSAP